MDEIKPKDEVDVRKKILSKFMYNKSMKYNEIRDNIPSNKFNYHLQSLASEGLIEQSGEKYLLTPKGTGLISSLDGIQIEEKRKPLVCAFVMAKKGNKILVNERRKQPFLGYLGLPGGKLDFGNSLPDQAAQELFEETGLRAKKFELKLITSYRTFDENKNEMSHHVIGFFFLASGISGTLKEEDREGRNMFITKEQASKMQKYPEFDIYYSDEIMDAKYPLFKEATRMMKDGEFTAIKFY